MLVRASIAALLGAVWSGAVVWAAEPVTEAPPGPPAGQAVVLTARDTLTGRLRRPAGVSVDAFGRVTVADEERHSLERFGADGRWLDGAGALGSATTQFRRPGTVTALGALGIAVFDRDNRRVVAYDQQLRLIGIVADFASDEALARFGRVDPVALTADAGGSVTVADSDRDRLLVFDFAGAFVREIGGFGGRAGAFHGIVAVASAPLGGMVTLERGARPRRARRAAADSSATPARLQLLDAGGRVLRSVPLGWDGADGPGTALAVDRLGRMAVVNGDTGELRLLSPEGLLLATLAGLRSASALAFGPDGALWVAETGAGRVRSFTIGPAPAEE